MHDYMPVIVTISLLAALIAVLKVFFTLWEPIDRWLNGEKKFSDDTIFLSELKDATVDIHLKSKTILEGIVLFGYFGRYKGTPNELRQVLVAKRPDGTKTYIRFEAIEFMEISNHHEAQPSPRPYGSPAAGSPSGQA